MKRLRFRAVSSLAVASFLALSISACSTGPKKFDEPKTDASGVQSQKLPLVGSYQVHRFVLPNGLRLLVVENHESPTFAYQTWFRVGSRDEVPGYTGLAHLFEHMMFKETKNLKEGEFDKILEGAGAEGENAFTSRDYTAYVQELPSDKLDLIARLEADRMVNLIVNEKAFKTETEVVQNERRFRMENNPDGLMYQDLFGTAFTKHPYHWPVIGYQEDLDRMSAKDAVEFYKTYYSPNHATIAVVGDVKPEQVLETVKKYYAQIPSVPSQIRTHDPEPAQTAPKRKLLKLNMQVEKLILGYRIPPIVDETSPVLDVIQGVLTGGKSSRLNRALVETGIASGVEAYEMEDKDPSLFVVGVNLQKGKKAAQAESVILKELERLAKEPVPAQEMERVKNGISFHFFDGLSANTEIANFLGRYETITPSFRTGIDAYEKIAQVTPEDVQRVVKQYLSPKNRTVITGVPK